MVECEMGMRSELFSDSEHEEIRRAVTAAEAATSGEIVAMVVPESDRYREAEVLGGVLLAGLPPSLRGYCFITSRSGSSSRSLSCSTFPAGYSLQRFPG